MTRLVLSLCLIVALLSSAYASFGHLGSLGRGFGKLGGSPKGGTGSVSVDCPADGLDFQDGCGTTQFMVML